MWRVIRNALFLLPPETAHQLTFWGVSLLDKIHWWHKSPPVIAPLELWGLQFAHPVGLAAGLDKNAELLTFWAHLGFAFVEVGTVTLRPQPGNPPPRLFRIPQDKALLNRMGFNNDGAIVIARRLERRPDKLILGINIGKNRDTPLNEAHRDYAEAFRILRDLGDFFVVNVSSPNTPGLRSLQTKEALRPIIEAIQRENTPRKPVLLKLSPDLSDEAIHDIGEAACQWGISGFVAGNTTTQVRYTHLGEGGVSGAPLKSLRQRLIRQLKPFGLPIIGVGGILSPIDAMECLSDGAQLIELYTGLIYEGPPLLRRILRQLRTP